MRFITALSRHRIDRQQYCIDTWKKHASQIVAVQTKADIEIIAPHFPEIDFIETDLTGEELYQLPNRVRIKALVDRGPGLLINSDIKITSTQEEFNKDWTVVENQFNVGIRYDFDKPGTPKKLNKYGIDAFLITKEIKEKLPDIGFVIGVSVWDYWIIWHMFCERYHIQAKTTPGLLHLNHQLNWSEKETKIGLKLMTNHYNLKDPKKILDAIIPALTNR